MMSKSPHLISCIARLFISTDINTQYSTKLDLVSRSKTKPGSSIVDNFFGTLTIIYYKCCRKLDLALRPGSGQARVTIVVI